MDKRLEESLTKNMTYSQKALDTKKKELELQDAYYKKHPERKNKGKKFKKGKIGSFLMSENIIPPSELPSFNDKARKHTVYNVNKQWNESSDTMSKGRIVKNPIHFYFKVFGTYNEIPSVIEDIIHGVCNLDFYGKGMAQDIGLSKSKVFYLLKQKEINYGFVSSVFDINKRQAQRYVQAVKMLINLLDKQMDAVFVKEAQRFEQCAIKDIEYYNMEECADFNRSEYIQDVIQSCFVVIYDGALDWDRENQKVIEGDEEVFEVCPISDP